MPRSKTLARGLIRPLNARRSGMRRHSEAVTVLLEGLVAIAAKAVSPLRFATAVQSVADSRLWLLKLWL